VQHVDFRGNVWDCGIGNNEPHYKDIEYYGFTYMIPKYKIQPPDDFCEYYQTHKDEIIIELDKKTKEQKEEIERLNNIIYELEKILQEDYDNYVCKNRQYGTTYKAGANTYREHILYRLKELKGE